MKTKSLILVSALCAAMPAMALDSTPGNAILVQPQSKSLHVANPFAKTKASDNKSKAGIDRVGEMSSQPWSQIVGWHNGEPATLMDAKVHEPRLHLLWFGAEPNP
jgi:hypothetical protein